MNTYFLYPTLSSYDDIRGYAKTEGVLRLEAPGAFMAVSDKPIDQLRVQLPEVAEDCVVVLSSLVRVWSVTFSGSDPVLAPNTTLELDFGTSIQLNYSTTENCWVLFRSF